MAQRKQNIVLRVLDHLEEWLIATLIAAATALIFFAVIHRYGTGLSINFAKWLAAHGVPLLPSVFREHLYLLRRHGRLLGAGTLHLHVHLDGEVRRRVRRADRHPRRRRRPRQPAAAGEAQEA